MTEVHRIAYIDDCRENLDCFPLVFPESFEFETFQSPESFYQAFNQTSYAAILLDVHMPQESGFDMYERIISHPNYNGCPIMFISGDESFTVKLKSFQLGAVDFLSRLTQPDELVARLKSKIAYYQKNKSLIELSKLKMNLTQLKTYLDGHEIPLTFIELKILSLAMRRFPEIISKDDVISEVWRAGMSAQGSIYTHLSNLNAKIKAWDYEVVSIKGQGIQLTKKEDEV